MTRKTKPHRNRKPSRSLRIRVHEFLTAGSSVSRQLARCVRQQSQLDFERPFVLGVDGAQSGDAFAIIAVQRDGERWDFAEWVFDTPPEDTGFYDLPQIEELIAGARR